MARLLHLNHRYWPVIGGSEQSVRAIAVRQALAGHEVVVLTTNALAFSAFWDPHGSRLPAVKEKQDGVEIVRTPVGNLPGKLWSFAAIRRAQSILARTRWIAAGLGKWVPYLPQLEGDVAELGSNWDAVFGWNITFDHLSDIARRIAQQGNSPFFAVPFLHLGEGPHSKVRRLYTMPHQLDILRAAERVILQTDISLDFLLQHGFSQDRLAVVGLGIDPSLLQEGDAGPLRKREGLDTFVVTAIGPLTLDKGTQHLVEAARIVRQSGVEIALVLAGPPMSDFEAYWKRLPSAAKEHVFRLGPVYGQEKSKLLASSSVLVLPSRTDSFGIVLLEAWSYAKPVIGASAGGIPGLIDDGSDGRLVPYADPKSLAAAIMELIRDPEKAKQWGNRGRTKVLERYTWDKVYERFVAATGIA